MRAVKSRDTTPELAVRKSLFALGYRYRLNRADLPGKPDIVFPGRKTVVFVHGCFWHGHNCARGSREPKSNSDYWRAKIGRNRLRDSLVAGQLAAMGWRVVTVWECETRNEVAMTKRLQRALSPKRK